MSGVQRWVPGSLLTSRGRDNGCQWMSGDSGYVSPSRGNQKVIWRSGVCADVYPGVDEEPESSDV